MNSGCLNKALQLLARRDHSVSELRAKLRLRDYDSGEIQIALDECLRLGYLDDARYANGYMRQLQRKGYGILGIKYKLHTKGVSQQIINQCAAPYESDDTQRSVCRQALEKKIRYLGQKRSIRNMRPSLQRFLLGRGFSHNIVYQVVEEAMERER